jgi:hypothetical protein
MDMRNISKYKGQILSIFIVAILLLGLSFAWLTLTLNSTKKNAITAGNLSIVLSDTASNGISLENAYPLSDADGQETTEYTFTITNNGTLVSDYTIYLDDTALETGETRISDSAIKYSISKNSGSSTIALLNTTGTDPNRILNSGTIATGVTDTYSLRVWMADSATIDDMGKVFRGIFNATNIGANGAINTTDTDETFITGTNPNNYVWYSGKLWRAVAKNTSDNSVKLVTQWDISAVPYNASATTFSGSYMEQWLNDTGSDGFLGTLYNYTNYIKTDSSWNATLDATALGSITKPANTTMVTDAVGLLNMYEYQMSYTGATYGTGYLNNGLYWWTLTPYSASDVRYVYISGDAYDCSPTYTFGVRPSINLKSSVIISGGSGTETDPYTLSGDTSAAINDLLNTRKSGEYVTFDGGSYRIVDVEDSTTQLVSSEPLKVSGSFTTKAFDSNSTTTVLYTPTSSTNIGYYLNNDWYNSISSTYQAMIVEGTWYLGTVGDGTNYSLSKCTTAGINCTKNQTNVTAKAGLLRLGEELSGQFNRYLDTSGSTTGLTTNYWLLTPCDASYVRVVYSYGFASSGSPTFARGVRPSINLKSSVKITGGAGTKSNPYTIG